MDHDMGRVDCFLLGYLIMGIFGIFLCSFFFRISGLSLYFFFLRVLVRVLSNTIILYHWGKFVNRLYGVFHNSINHPSFKPRYP